MLNLSQLSNKEKVYLTELANIVCDPPIEFEVLYALKPGVLQYALQVNNPPSRKRKVIEKIINKIIVKPQILEGEILTPKERQLND